MIDYSGSSLVNLSAELESRLIGSAPSPTLHPELADVIPEGSTYILALFDGLGSSQLGHPKAEVFRDADRGTIDAAFPTTTTVSMATLATGLSPSQHGLLAYQLYLPEVEAVVNTLKWSTLWGDPVAVDYEAFLPAPSVPERLAAVGKEAVTVQPGNFEGTPLSRVLYRGHRFEAVFTEQQIIEATLALAAVPGRLVFSYIPHIDVAGHISGQDSADYAQAVEFAAGIWSRIAEQLPDGVVMVGTADHGHVDIPGDRQLPIPEELQKDRILYGDSRVMFVKGDGASMCTDLPATWVPLSEMVDWWGPEPRHPAFDERAPDGALVVDDGYLLLHRFSDSRLIGHHGGLTPAERRVPLLVAS